MYSINKDTVLTTDRIAEIIQKFRGNEGVIMQRYHDYFMGRQDILNKAYLDINKPCNKIVKNYCNSIVNNFLGYIVGKPITYTSGNDIDSLLDIFLYNDIKNADSHLLKNALTFGVAYELAYIDEDAANRFKTIDSRECIPVCDDTVNENLTYMIRFYRNPNSTKEGIVEVYSKNAITRYKTNEGYSSLLLIDETKHYFQQVPFTIFKLNEESESVFAQIITMQDAYNKLLSGEIDDFEGFCDAYLLLTGVSADAEDIAKMKENRVLLLDAESNAEYLTKDIKDTQIENMLKNLNDSIHVISNSPDFNDEKFMATSGIAMKYKLVGFENTSSSIVSNMIKALQKRVELLYTVLQLTTGDAWKDVNIQFTRNLPQDTIETVNVVNQLRGIVSDETLLSLLPFVDNAKEELERLSAESKANVDMYAFGDGE